MYCTSPENTHRDSTALAWYTAEAYQRKQLFSSNTRESRQVRGTIRNSVTIKLDATCPHGLTQSRIKLALVDTNSPDRLLRRPELPNAASLVSREFLWERGWKTVVFVATLTSNLTRHYFGVSARTSFWLAHETWKPFEQQLLPWRKGQRVCFFYLVTYFLLHISNFTSKTCVFFLFFSFKIAWERRTDKKWNIIIKFKFSKGCFFTSSS